MSGSGWNQMKAHAGASQGTLWFQSHCSSVVLSMNTRQTGFPLFTGLFSQNLNRVTWPFDERDSS